jgi:hypothetical protein
VLKAPVRPKAAPKGKKDGELLPDPKQQRTNSPAQQSIDFGTQGSKK